MYVAYKENLRGFRRRSDGKQEWTSLVQGFLKLMKERKHMNYKEAFTERVVSLCTIKMHSIFINTTVAMEIY
jgi:hypothetical protein